MSNLIEDAALRQSAETTLGLTLGSFLSFHADGSPLVDFEGNETGSPLIALSCVALTAEKAGCEVALSFVNGDRRQPVILGVIQRKHHAESKPLPAETTLPAGVEVKISADQELVLQCGKASITLTRDGKILLSGEYLLSRSYGVNQIQGACIQVN